MSAIRGYFIKYFVICVLCFSIKKVSAAQLPKTTASTGGNAIQFWPDGIIPYRIPGTFSETDIKRIHIAMKQWERVTCVKFVPWSEDVHQQLGAKRYVEFYKGSTCFSRNGMHQFQPQLLGLSAACIRKMGTIVHEVGHAIGLRHTMERDDRDFYIDVNYENVNPDSRDNFDTTSMRGFQNYPLFNTPYDYKSVMHYGPKTWSRNNKVVIVTKDPAYQSVIGNANTLSFYDAVYVNRAYECAANCSTQETCFNGGAYGGPGGDNCFCICPEGFLGRRCEHAVDGYRHIVQWDCGNNWEFANGRCYRFFQSSVFLSHSIATRLCQSHNATLVKFDTKTEVEWLSHRIEELFSLTTIQSFWLGAKRLAGNITYTWSDGSVYNHQLMPLHDLGSKDHDGCATTNGKAVIVESCSTKQHNEAICMRDFEPACGGRYRLTQNSEVNIQTPGYPEQYQDRTCQYVLQAPKGSNIEVKFEDFDVYESSNCHKDSVSVQKTNDVTQAGSKYCGNQLLNETIVSDGNLVILTFTSVRKQSKRGFKASVRTRLMPHDRVACRRPTRLLDMLAGTSNCNTGDSQANSILDILWNLVNALTASTVL